MPRHRCDESTIDYSAVDDGNLVCAACGRVWYLTDAGWRMMPQQPAPPRAADTGQVML